MAAISDGTAEAFEFIERLDSINRVDDVISLMERSLARFGFEHFVIAGLPNPKQPFAPLVVLRKLPAGWFEHYVRHDYATVDPVIRHCRNTIDPFEWHEAPYDAELEPKSREVMERACDFGMRRGFSLPIHNVDGYEACVSLSGRDLDLDRRTKPAVHLMAMYAFQRAKTLLAPLRQFGRTPLTEREQEVLRWTAAGKSAWETGVILNITKRTVDEHIAKACRRLGARNKTQAVALAIHHRLVTL